MDQEQLIKLSNAGFELGLEESALTSLAPA